MDVSPSELAALGCAFLWALNGLLLRTQSELVTPSAMNVIRCGVAGLLFVLLLPFDPAPLAGLLAVPGREWGLFLASILLGLVVGDTLYLVALKEIGVARTMALTGTYPLATLLSEWFLLDYPVRSNVIFGSVLVVAGVVFLSIRSRATPAGDADQPSRLAFGVFVAFASALLWGLSSALVKPGIASMSLVQANALRMPLVALLLYLVRVRPSHRETLGSISPRSFLVVASTGVLGMGLGAGLFLYAIHHASATKVVTLTSVSPLFGILMAMLFLKEKLTLRAAAGTACCLAGVWVVL